MNNIKEILLKKKIFKSSSKRPINIKWEQAEEFGRYVGIQTPMVMRLFKLYGLENVLAIKSWLSDIPFDPAKGGKIALANWKLKELQRPAEIKY